MTLLTDALRCVPLLDYQKGNQTWKKHTPRNLPHTYTNKSRKKITKLPAKSSAMHKLKSPHYSLSGWLLKSLQKWHLVFNIVHDNRTRSCVFTVAYLVKSRTDYIYTASPNPSVAIMVATTTYISAATTRQGR